jgi:hypothetical protein
MIATATTTMVAQTISAAAISPFLFILPLIPPKTIASRPYRFAVRDL